MDDRADNAAEMGKAEARLAGARVWFWGWLVVLLLGPGLIPLGLFVVDDGIVGVPLIIGGIILLIAGLVGVFWMAGSCSRARRRVALAEYAGRCGYEYIDRPDRRKLGFLDAFQLIAGPGPYKTGWLVRGEAGGHHFLAMDCRIVWNKGPEEAAVSQTILVLESCVKGVPGLSVSPRGMWQAPGLVVRGQDAFNKAFVLASQEFEAAPRAIGPGLAAFCVAEKRLAFESRGDDLLVYWPGELLPPDRLDERLSIACEVARLLRGKF